MTRLLTLKFRHLAYLIMSKTTLSNGNRLDGLAGDALLLGSGGHFFAVEVGFGVVVAVV